MYTMDVFRIWDGRKFDRAAAIGDLWKRMTKKRFPQFTSDVGGQKFWATADSTAYVDWSSGKRVKLVNLKPPLKTSQSGFLLPGRAIGARTPHAFEVSLSVVNWKCLNE